MRWRSRRHYFVTGNDVGSTNDNLACSAPEAISAVPMMAISGPAAMPTEPACASRGGEWIAGHLMRCLGHAVGFDDRRLKHLSNSAITCGGRAAEDDRISRSGGAR
jgi:hypothetical protein